MNPTKLESQLVSYMDFLKERPPGQVPTNRHYGIEFRKRLVQLGYEIENKLDLSNQFPSLAAQTAKGANVIPLIAWIVILPRGRKVSTWHSVGICFDISGNGLVAGILWSPLGPSNFSPAERGIKLQSLVIDSGKNDTNYSRKFVNGKEFIRPEIFESEVIEHLRNSLNLLNGQ